MTVLTSVVMRSRFSNVARNSRRVGANDSSVVLRIEFRVRTARRNSSKTGMMNRIPTMAATARTFTSVTDVDIMAPTLFFF